MPVDESKQSRVTRSSSLRQVKRESIIIESDSEAEGNNHPSSSSIEMTPGKQKTAKTDRDYRSMQGAYILDCRFNSETTKASQD
jgi:hypothetical protein